MYVHMYIHVYAHCTLSITYWSVHKYKTMIHAIHTQAVCRNVRTYLQQHITIGAQLLALRTTKRNDSITNMNTSFHPHAKHLAVVHTYNYHTNQMCALVLHQYGNTGSNNIHTWLYQMTCDNWTALDATSMLFLLYQGGASWLVK